MRLSTDPFVTSKVPKPGAVSAAASSNMARFYFNSLSMPVRASVMHQDAAGMTLRQELPFLELHGKLRDESGREGSLENVSIYVRDGVPSLVLDIRYDDARRDATVPFLMESTRAMRATKTLFTKLQSTDAAFPSLAKSDKTRRDETLPYGVQTQGRREAPVLPSVENLKQVASSPLAPRPRHRRNSWWARMCRSFVALFR